MERLESSQGSQVADLCRIAGSARRDWRAARGARSLTCVESSRAPGEIGEQPGEPGR